MFSLTRSDLRHCRYPQSLRRTSTVLLLLALSEYELPPQWLP